MTDKDAAAQGVATKLDAFERTMDDAIARYGEVLSALAAARTGVGVSTVFGHEVFELATVLGSSLVAARGEIVPLHQRLGAIQRRLGITMSPLGDKEPTFAAAEPARGLTIAA